MNKDLLIGLLCTALIGAGCGGSTSHAMAAPTNAASASPAVSGTTAEAKTGTVATAGAAPVELTYLGLESDKQNFRYRVKIVTTQPIRQVDITYQCFDAAGQPTDDLTVAWQNIVKSTQQPIERGKTYEDSAPLMAEAARCNVELGNVYFTDDTHWSAK